MFSKFLKLPFTLIVFIGGILLIIVAFYTPSELTKLSFTPRINYVWPLFIIGILLVITSFVMYLLPNGILKLYRRERPLISTKANDTTIRILFGKIEDYECSQEDTAIVLSGNEYFDDHVFYDRSTALGAYLHKYFEHDLDQLIKVIRDALKNYPSQLVEKEKGKFEKSYGIGATLFLDRPLHSNKRLILTSAITRRADEGLRADMTYICNSVRSVFQLLQRTQIHRIFLPILGAGHGGITQNLALFILLSTIIEFLRRKPGHHIHEVNIIVFQANKKSPPEISEKDVQQILDIVLSICK